MVSIRPLVPQDRSWFRESFCPMGSIESVDAIICQSMARQLDGRYCQLLAILDGGTPVGYLSLIDHPEVGVSVGVEIAEVHRRKGYAFRGLRLAMEYVKALGYCALFSEVRTDNSASVALHKKLGFEPFEETVNRKGNRVYHYHITL